MLLRQTILYLPAQVVGPIFQFISVVAWTHFLSPESMGVFALISATQELAYTVSLFWFTLYTMRHYNSANAEAQRQFLDSESAVIASSAIVSLIMVVGLSMTVDTQWSMSLLVSGVAYVLTRAIVTQFSDRARTEHDTVTYSVLQMAWPVLGLAFGLVLVKLIAPTAAAVLWGYTLAQVLSIVIALMRLDFGKNPFHASRDVIKAALRYGLPLLAGGVFVWIANNGLRFIVEHYQGATAVGLVTVGWALGLRAANFAAMLVTAAAFPIAVRRTREGSIAEGQSQLERNGVLLLVALLPAAIGLWLVARPFVTLVVAEPYREITIAVLPMAILAGTLRNLRIHFGAQVFLLREQTMVPLCNDIVDAVLSLAGAVIGLWYYGLVGSVAGASVGALVSLFVTLGWAWHWHRFSIPLRDVVKVIAATAIMGVVVSQMTIAPTALSIGLAAVVGAAVYALVIALLYLQEARAAVRLVMRQSAERGA